LILPGNPKAPLQSLDRGVFGQFKTFLKRDANRWVNTHQNVKVTKMHLGILIGGAWNKPALVANSVSAFKSTGMFPLDQNVISDNL
jgi:hypothetical protein